MCNITMYIINRSLIHVIVYLIKLFITKYSFFLVATLANLLLLRTFWRRAERKFRIFLWYLWRWALGFAPRPALKR